PNSFSGDVAECRGYLLQVKLFIAMQPHRFVSDRAKIAFLISLLSGIALAWARSLWSANSVALASFAAFTTHVTEVFCTGTGALNNADEFLHLHQGADAVAEYSLRFCTLAASSGWNENALLSVYRQGLNPAIRMAMATHVDAVGLETFIQRSISVSQHLSACSMPDSTPPTASAAASGTTPEPMQLGFQRLSRRERKRRQTTGACPYCGKSGHSLPQCTARPQ
ncbi:nephrocystin-4-like, partial [Silurus asotus]